MKEYKNISIKDDGPQNKIIKKYTIAEKYDYVFPTTQRNFLIQKYGTKFPFDVVRGRKNCYFRLEGGKSLPLRELHALVFF